MKFIKLTNAVQPGAEHVYAVPDKIISMARHPTLPMTWIDTIGGKDCHLRVSETPERILEILSIAHGYAVCQAERKAE